MATPGIGCCGHRPGPGRRRRHVCSLSTVSRLFFLCVFARGEMRQRTKPDELGVEGGETRRCVVQPLRKGRTFAPGTDKRSEARGPRDPWHTQLRQSTTLQFQLGYLHHTHTRIAGAAALVEADIGGIAPCKQSVFTPPSERWERFSDLFHSWLMDCFSPPKTFEAHTHTRTPLSLFVVLFSTALGRGPDVGVAGNWWGVFALFFLLGDAGRRSEDSDFLTYRRGDGLGERRCDGRFARSRIP